MERPPFIDRRVASSIHARTVLIAVKSHRRIDLDTLAYWLPACPGIALAVSLVCLAECALQYALQLHQTVRSSLVSSPGLLAACFACLLAHVALHRCEIVCIALFACF